MKQTTKSLLACIAALAVVGPAQAANLATVGVYDEDVVKTDTIDAVSPTANNTLTLSDVKTLMADAFAADTGGVWQFESQGGAFPASNASGTTFTLSYGTSQSKTLGLTATFGGSIGSSNSGSAISLANNLGLTTAVGTITWTPSQPLTLVAIAVVDRVDANKKARLVATLQDNTTISTAESASNTDTLHVLTATAANPIKSFQFVPTAGNLLRYDDLAFITAAPQPPPRPLGLSGFTYSKATGDCQVSIKGLPSTPYKLVEANDLDFGNPDQAPIPLTGATVGALENGDTEVRTDGGGNATVQFNLGTTKPASFCRAEIALPIIVPPGTPIKVFLAGGQSNMTGIAKVDDAPAGYEALKSPQTDVLMVRGQENVIGTTIQYLQPHDPPASDSDQRKEFGPEVPFGRAMADAFPATRFAIIKYSKGSTSLVSDWRPPDSGIPGDLGGGQYQKFKQTVINGMSALTNAGYAPEIIGMIWHQGEADRATSADDPAAKQAEYESMLNGFIADIRSNYGQNLPFMIGEVNKIYRDDGVTVYNTYPISAAQEAVGTADPFATFVPADDLFVGDNVHLNAAGVVGLGGRFATYFTTQYYTSP